jgi:hypothetical protein
MHATIEELLEVVFSMGSMLRLYNVEQLQLWEPWDGSEKSKRLVWDGGQPGSELWDSRQPVKSKHGSWGSYGVESHYQATTGEDTADWEDLVRAVMNCRVCKLAIAL